MAGLPERHDRPTSGEVFFDSRPVNFVEAELKALRRRVVMLDQQPILFSTTVYKNVEFGLKIRKVDRARRRQRVEEALDTVGMLKFSEKQATTLSGGESQRVALARVLVLQPEVLLCDEPTASVDHANQVGIVDLLRTLNSKEKMSIVFSTHDQELPGLLAHKTIHLDPGLVGPEAAWFPSI